jgi:hypothetical protein
MLSPIYDQTRNKPVIVYSPAMTRAIVYGISIDGKPLYDGYFINFA